MIRDPAESTTMTTACCIVGGGPAGIITGYLLARAGVDVIVLEKHTDFFRDFRGDTIHPSTLRVIDELGHLDELLAIPHSELTLIAARFGAIALAVADFGRLPGRNTFMAVMPQWDFLSFCAEQAKRYPSFRLCMSTEATDLTYDGDRVVGVRALTATGPLTIGARLVIAADGRASALRARAGLEVIETGAPIDVLWMRLPKRPGDPAAALGNIGTGGLLVTIDRVDYYQCALVIPKGGYDEIRATGLEALRARIVALAPFFANRVGELRVWDDVKLLTVKIDHLRTWYRAGFLCIGDAAHAMSPVGGVGINLAVQDGVAAANLLATTLLTGTPSRRQLAAVQRRRALPARLIQAGQVAIQERVLKPLLASHAVVHPPAVMKLLDAVPWLRVVPAYIIGMGFRPEHVRTPERLAA